MIFAANNFESRRIASTLAAIAVALVGAGSAAARTATFVSPSDVDGASLTAVSTAGDNAGYTVLLSVTFAIVFDAPFAAVKSADTITIFTLAPGAGTARATVSFGVYNGGAPIIVQTSTVNAGNSLSVGNLFQAGCSVFGGCDYIAVTTTRARAGAAGVEVDYVDVNGEIVEIAAPAPEPAVWALLILGFTAVAARLTAARRRSGGNRRRARVGTASPRLQRRSAGPLVSSG